MPLRLDMSPAKPRRIQSGAAHRLGCRPRQSVKTDSRPWVGDTEPDTNEPLLAANLLDDRSGGAVLHQAKYPHFTAIGLDDIGTDHLVDAIVTALDQHVGLHLLEQTLGRVFAEAHHPVHRSKTG